LDCRRAMPRLGYEARTFGYIRPSVTMRISGSSHLTSMRHCRVSIPPSIPPRTRIFNAVIRERARSRLSHASFNAAFERWGDTRWKRPGDEYDALKERLAARLLAELKRRAPSVVGNIAYTELSTPVTTRHFMNCVHREIYGIASTPDRFLIRELGARTPIRGLYLTGQDAASLGVVNAVWRSRRRLGLSRQEFLFGHTEAPCCAKPVSPMRNWRCRLADHQGHLNLSTSSSMALSRFGRRHTCIMRWSNELRYKTFCE
jgi:hypothetical protein